MTCEALQRIMATKLDESRRKGLSEGRIEDKRESEMTGEVLAYADMGLSLEAIAEKV